ncbi:mitochondrial thiamine pyrophosphate transporter [Lobosporangium transversale]|uniref:Mitochondrial carrier domain-containing protein n=1 Tax=Lobosporangium transversale TaxID=64571 RepID=A0A1Y2GFP2_9FUNG|nr:mitochondrial carrier domain-containing protein [Lobosporangium transversale]KAF9898669.1 mitochondrial thiamine pyrophosphate transporter [Lobosporangium transversale]ORZ09441.1 mitochondrial carrier domain-containing protein [Lobosporangium transversale]|eukprot:XP_021878894.1 mitochondrial carrier domain-containing protein [Lobosporangium transversale]
MASPALAGSSGFTGSLTTTTQGLESSVQRNNKNMTSGAPTLTKAETALCGSTAGVVSRFVIAPLDVVKIRLQLQTQRKELPKVLRKNLISDGSISNRSRIDKPLKLTPNIGASIVDAQPKYKGMISGLSIIAREEGIRGLWKGNMAAEYLYMTYGGIQFLVYQQTKALLSKTAEATSYRLAAYQLNNPTTHAFTTIINSASIQSFVSGASAGIIATTCTYPFDLLRTRFAIQRDVKTYTSVPQAFQHIIKRDGVRGFYKGMSPALVQVIPYMGIMFGSYDTLKRLTSWCKQRSYGFGFTTMTGSSPPGKSMKMTPTTDPPHKPFEQFMLGLEEMLCGGISGVISKTAVYPLDMVRKRLQIQGSEQQRINIDILSSTSNRTSTLAGTASERGGGVPPIRVTKSEVLPTTIWRCMAQIIQQEGYLALYKGLLPGLLKAAPASAVTFLVFSQMGILVERIRRPTPQPHN